MIPNDIQKMKAYDLLLVDDDAMTLKSLTSLLTMKGYKITPSNSGEDAIEKLTRRHFDLVITDLVMYKIDGIRVLTEAKSRNKETKVIILTGYGNLTSAIDAVRLGVDDYILKPCDPEEIFFRISRCMDNLELQRKVKNAYAELERRVKERTLKLAETNERLQNKTRNLEETNTALKVLLKRRDEDRIELEEKIMFNIKELIEPYLEKLKNTNLNERQMNYISILESNIADISSPFIREMTARYLQLTPTEIKVANLVKQGKTTKEIARLLNLSPRTIETHRNNVRKKIGINNKKGNLRTFLLSLQ
jgi:DNA-binding NarL/FixJ family response regulator